MKIRSDFVTNSSSSNYIVNILIKDVDGNEFVASSDPYFESEGRHNLSCTAEELRDVRNVSELAKMLCDSLTDDKFDAFDETDEYNLTEVKELGNTLTNILINEIKDISRIDFIRLTRIWSTWGEGSCCFNANMDLYAPELRELSQNVLDTKGDEKELAKAELSSYLKSYGGIIEGGEMGGKFPTGFLGAKVKGSLEWNKCAENIEEFAWKVVNDCLPEDDYAEETTEIDMQKHKIKQTAKYIFDGFDVDDDLED